jgi:1-hydroxycarotenoid 3,4-desaturase
MSLEEAVHGKGVVIVGAGIGGLAAAMALAASGERVTVIEKEAGPGGKMRTLRAGAYGVDAGPTVLTLREVFEALFEHTGLSLDDALTLTRADVLARHAWDGGGALDLYADQEQSADAIGSFAGAAEARGYRAFCDEAANIHRILERTFIKAEKPSLPKLIWRVGPHRFGDLWRINPYENLWSAVCRHMRDPRLRQLFARYATYCGSSPFKAPATLMLVAHVEQMGVWLVEGGMHRLAKAMMTAAERHDAAFRFKTEAHEILMNGGRISGVKLTSGEILPAEAVIVNADVSAAASGMLGAALKGRARGVHEKSRSLSALTWAVSARTSGFNLSRHTIFFSKRPYREEFDAIFRRSALPPEPTVYVCAQDRDSHGRRAATGAEPMLFVVNAPSLSKSHTLSQSEIDQCETTILALMQRCGLHVEKDSAQMIRTAPQDFARAFPGSGGAIYGRASHGWTASFRRQSARSPIPGLYFAGGSVHPGPGVPMAALSGQLAAEALLKDFVSMRRLHPAAMPGGISMPSAATAATD